MKKSHIHNSQRRFIYLLNYLETRSQEVSAGLKPSVLCKDEWPWTFYRSGPTSQMPGLTPSILCMLSKPSSNEATSFAPGILKPKQQPKQRNSADKSLLNIFAFNYGNIKVTRPVFHTQSMTVPHTRWLKRLSVLVVRTSSISSLTEAGRKGHVLPSPFVNGWQMSSGGLW